MTFNPYNAHAFPFVSAKDRCWSCDSAKATKDVGLCGECRDRLIAEGEEGR